MMLIRISLINFIPSEFSWLLKTETENKEAKLI